MKHADIYYRPSDHLTRFMTGLYQLEQQGLLTCRYMEDGDNQALHGVSAAACMEIDGKRLIFDLRDAPALMQEKVRAYLTEADHVFERSHIDWASRGIPPEQAAKIHPYGFNYYTTCPGNRAYTATPGGNPLKRIARDLLNRSPLSRASAFEGRARPVKGQPRILFMTRLWDPAEVKIRPDMSEAERAYREKRRAEREVINQDRIRIIRELRRTYGRAFTGGVQDSSFARKMCPDLILPARMTLKTSYMRRMKRADICIGSAGLEQSIGWKTGEYVAAARAIVCEEMAYLLPGGFQQGTHYLPYTDAESCLKAVETLAKDPERLYRMQQANEGYYREFLRPDVQILNALRTAGIEL